MLNFCGAQNLSEHQWRDRVLLVFAPAPDHDSLTRQLSILTKNRAGVTDRDLVIYQFFPDRGIAPDGTPIPTKKTDQWFHQFRVEKGQFAVLLIGKDGAEKLRREQVVARETLFGLIDSMPMRRAEMRKKQKGEGNRE